MHKRRNPFHPYWTRFLDHIQSEEFLKMISIIQRAQGWHFQILRWSYTIEHCYVVSISVATLPKFKSHHLWLLVH
jgi:hypothetical protein